MSAEPPTLVARQLTVERGGRSVLAGVDLEAAPGRVLAILGPNGAGKTTLLRALAGLSPYRGTIELRGRELSAIEPRERARSVAYVPQKSELVAGLTVANVVAQGRYAHRGGWGRAGPSDRAALASALERADVASFGDRRFDRLSVGEQRRVLLARALATEAGVVLLDEPSAALDIGHQLQLFGLLRALAEGGATLIVVLHALDAARRFADDAVLLERGVVHTAGPVAEVVAAGPVREVYGVSMKESAALGFELPEASS